jgi:hypothetical protein
VAKFKCHPTIPCDIPRADEDLNALWYHISDELLPTNWSSDWLEYQCTYWFLPNKYDAYSMGTLDIVLKAHYRIPYPIKGIMYSTVDREEPGGLFEQQLCPGNHECIVFQDALGEYYFYYDFSQGGDEYLAKFRAPRGTTVSEFLRDHFRGGVKGVDMDLVLPENEFGTAYYYSLRKEQRDLAVLQAQAQAESRCACQHAATSIDAKMANLRLVE